MKRPLIYLGIAIVVAVAVWAVERPDMAPTGDKDEELIFPEFDAEAVARIEYEHLIGGVQLRRDSEGWQVAALATPMKLELAGKEGRRPSEAEWSRADRRRVRRALGVFGDLTRGVLVSKNPENQALYQVNDMGQKIRMFDGEGRKIVDMVIGKNGPDFVSSYVRLEGQDEVYLVDRTLTGIFSVEADDWREKEATASSDDAGR